MKINQNPWKSISPNRKLISRPPGVDFTGPWGRNRGPNLIFWFLTILVKWWSFKWSLNLGDLHPKKLHSVGGGPEQPPWPYNKKMLKLLVQCSRTLRQPMAYEVLSRVVSHGRCQSAVWGARWPPTRNRSNIWGYANGTKPPGQGIKIARSYGGKRNLNTFPDTIFLTILIIQRFLSKSQRKHLQAALPRPKWPCPSQISEAKLPQIAVFYQTNSKTSNKCKT